MLGVLYLTGSILDLVGRFICLAVPEEVGSAKPLITISVVLQIGSLVGSILNVAADAGGLALPVPAKLAISLGSGVAGIAAIVLFILFIRSVCRYIRRQDLANRAMTVIWLWVGCVVGYVVAIVVMLGAGFAAGGFGGGGQGGAAGGAMAAGGCLGAIVGLAVLIMALVALVLYAMLLTGASAAVRQYAQRRSSRYGDFDDEDEEDGYDEDDDEDDRPRRRKRDDDDDDDRGGRRWER